MEKEQTKNQQEKNQQENQKKSQKVQWHPAFCSALRLELLEDAENLEFTDEFQLTEKPLQIDCTVVKPYSVKLTIVLHPVFSAIIPAGN